MKLLEVNNLKKHFSVNDSFLANLLNKNSQVHAVNGVSFSINKGETLSLVGESGCGKSTIGRTILGLYEPTEGEISYCGKKISQMSKKEKFGLKEKMQMIFQDPFSSLNPRQKVKDIIQEPIRSHNIVSREEEKDYILNLLDKVGVDGSYLNRYPHQFSGGQRQRIGIARSLSMEPDFIVADEPISALDVSIQAQILNLLMDLQDEFDLTFLFIAHDLSVVKHISDRVAIMYLGKIFEIGDKKDIFAEPLHPYTKALFNSIPELTTTTKENFSVLSGNVPDPIQLPQGCYFHSRCKYAEKICLKKEPELKEVNGRKVACHQL
ncbi:MAG: dipeptide ABC transporter ATP-binding protein [Halanaerobiales bacterium]|nr:dipeptide ABC transporter ATP-binding protein [Halanaerobiales bacterium]